MVHKFGGTSVASAERYQGVVEILLKEPGRRKAIVVSAMSKVTDALIELTELAKRRNPSYLEKLEALKERHIATVKALLPEGSGASRPSSPVSLVNDLRSQLLKVLDADFEDIKEILRGVWHIKTCSDRTVELVSGFGEIWSAQMLNAYMQSRGLGSVWLDARKVLVVEPAETSVAVDWTTSQKLNDEWFAQNAKDWVVITGFVASTADGIATTLRRNGSDYSASIFGALLKSEAITIWTDVDGVLSADPRLVPEAVVLDDMSYAEATELAYFGAKVVHPSTMAPAIKRAIPIWIRNTFNPTYPGTCIHSTSSSSAPIKGFATVDSVALINVEGTGMMGVPGVAQRLFGSLREVGVSVIMISQASSEHSICFAIPVAQAQTAKAAVERAFVAEIQQGMIQTIEVDLNCSILAAVGDNMVEQVGIAGRFLSALGRAAVNVRAIAQGSSERNISVVIARDEATRALRAVHSGFFLSNHTLSIGLIGIGWIGETLLKQLAESAEQLKREYKIDLRIRGIANSKTMVLADQALALSSWKSEFEKRSEAINLEKFARHIHAEHLPHAVIIDCTASADIASHYPAWLRSGLHVITPNKKANTQSMDFYSELRNAARAKGRHYLYETTVGAGLPVINTLRELVRTGDKVLAVEGVLSGTLSFIFNSFSATKPFSEVVAEAKARGYTEPDPRDDLSGTDVARKLVILAREMGLKIELSDVANEPLLPPELQTGSVEEFMARLPSNDSRMLSLLSEASGAGEVLRFVGRIDESGKASVSLRRYPKDHAFARIQSTDNIVAFRTSRYSAQPLIVQGPGAGPEVTAGGVFADILRLCSYLGAQL
jgi:aspartokinase/homoserine dehydrogenase 1